MIKLSTFMLDPVKAHELYFKEIEALNSKHREEIEELNRALQRSQKKNRALQENLKGLNKKLRNLSGGG